MNNNFPVPSKGALRVLRQILYASSLGTAATVFLEEPRRQICTVRKVLENRRKLQGARDYVSVTALAEREDEDTLTHLGRLLRRQGRVDFQDFPCNDPILPSDVGAPAAHVVARSTTPSQVRQVFGEDVVLNGGRHSHLPRARRPNGINAAFKNGTLHRTASLQASDSQGKGKSIRETILGRRRSEDDARAGERLLDTIEQVTSSSTGQTVRREDLVEAEKALRYYVGKAGSFPSPVKDALRKLLAFAGKAEDESVQPELLRVLHNDIKLGTSDMVQQLIASHYSEDDLAQIIETDLKIGRPEVAFAVLRARYHHDGGCLGTKLLESAVRTVRCVKEMLITKNWLPDRPLYLFHEMHRWYLDLDSEQNLLKTDLQSLVDKSEIVQAVGLLTSALPTEDVIRCTPAIIRIAFQLRWRARERKLGSCLDCLSTWMGHRKDEIDPWRDDLIEQGNLDIIEIIRNSLAEGCIGRATHLLGILDVTQLQKGASVLSRLAEEVLDRTIDFDELDNARLQYVRDVHSWAVPNGILDEQYVAKVLGASRKAVVMGSISKAADIFLSLASLELDFGDTTFRNREQRTFCKYSNLWPDSSELAAKLLNLVSRSPYDGATKVAKRLFRWLEVNGISTQQQLYTLVEMHHARHEHDQIVLLFDTYLMDHQDIPETIRQRICMAFAFSGPVKEAVGLLQSEWQRGCRLAPLAFTKLLERVWNSTRNLEQVTNLFVQMQSWIKHSDHELSIYNCMMSICVRASRIDEAECYLKFVQSNLEPNVFTYGICMFGKAVVGDWVEVKRLLKHVKDSGLMDVLRPHGCGAFFNRVLDIFRQSHGAQQTLDFLHESINIYSVPPDQKTSDIAVETFLEHQQLDLIPEWITYVNQRGYAMKLTESSFVRAFRKYMRTFRPTHDILFRLYSSLRVSNANWCMTGVLHVIRDAITFGLNKGLLSPADETDIAFRLQVVQRAEEDGFHGRAQNQAMEIQSQMCHAMSLGNPHRAVSLYKESLVDGLPHSAHHLEIAVEASIRSNSENLDEAMSLIEDASAVGIDTLQAFGPILNHRVSKGPLNETEVIDSIIEYYKSLDKQGVPQQRHFIVTSAANALILRGQPNAAIRLLNTIAQSEWVKQKPLDIAAMSVLVRAYAAAGYVNGIKWVIDHVFATNMPVDRKFVQDVRYARGRFHHLGRGELTNSQAIEACEDGIARLTEWAEMCRVRKNEQFGTKVKVGTGIIELNRLVQGANNAESAVESFLARGKHSAGTLQRGNELEVLVVDKYVDSF